MNIHSSNYRRWLCQWKICKLFAFERGNGDNIWHFIFINKNTYRFYKLEFLFFIDFLQFKYVTESCFIKVISFCDQWFLQKNTRKKCNYCTTHSKILTVLGKISGHFVLAVTKIVISLSKSDREAELFLGSLSLGSLVTAPAIERFPYRNSKGFKYFHGRSVPFWNLILKNHLRQGFNNNSFYMYIRGKTLEMFQLQY